jgi:hypothetical protein
MKNSIVILITVLVFSSCNNKYLLEQNSVLKFKESYYKSWSSGVRNGGSGYTVILMLEDNLSKTTTNVTLEGIYFKDKYTKLKNQNNNKYQANIIAKKNTISNGDTFALVQEKEQIKEEIPFALEGNEAVVSYLEKGKQKYLKIVLQKSKKIQFPM